MALNYQNAVRPYRSVVIIDCLKSLVSVLQKRVQIRRFFVVPLTLVSYDEMLDINDSILLVKQHVSEYKQAKTIPSTL